MLGPDRYAQAASSEPRLKAPAECPSAAEVAAGVFELVGEDASLADVSVEIVRHEQLWTARVCMPDGQRELSGESCRAVADAVVVVLALALDAGPRGADVAMSPATAFPAADSREPVPDVGGDDITVQSPASVPFTTATNVTPLRRSTAQLAVRAGMLAEVGMLPGPSLGPRLMLAFVRGAWSVELGMAALLARHAELGVGGPTGNIHWFGGQAAVCRVLQGPFTTCFGAESGLLVGTGFGVDQPATAHGAWLAGTASALWRHPLSSLSPLAWEVGSSVAVAIRRPEFGFDDLGVLHRASAVSGRLLVGLGWQ
jgi:hypothetical protein